MAQLKHVVDPFGEVNVYPARNGGTRVVATILMKPHREGAQTGIAIDGSGSMRKMYGMEDGGRVVSSLFAGATRKASNEITPVARKLCAYLARNIDADGGTTCIYWATGPGGSEVQVVGDLEAEQAERFEFSGPHDLGTGTQLLPAVRYFVDRFRAAPWGFYVFITDGELHDLDDVIAYSKRLAKDIAAGRRNPVKFVLIGLGRDVNERQMEELDDLDAGVDVDLWDHKLASEMRQLEEIFAEVVDKNARVADNGRILDQSGRVVRDYQGVGLPAFLEFTLPAGATSFTLEVNGSRVKQMLTDAPSAPPVVPVAPLAEQPKPAPKPVPPPVPAKKEEVLDAVPVAEVEEDPSAAEWRDLPLEFNKDAMKTDDDVDVDLDQAKD